MKFSDYRDQNLEEAKKSTFNKIQRGVGTTAVDNDGLEISDSVVVSSDLLLMQSGLDRKSVNLWNFRSGKKVGSFKVQELKSALRAFK